MSGGQAQLVAFGPQDEFLYDAARVSFFQGSYKRHTHFSQNIERQLMQGNPAANAMTTVKVDRRGDLLSYVYIAAKNGAAANWAAVIDHVELYIGGSLIDTQYYEFSEIALDIMATSQSKSSASNTLNYGTLTSAPFFPLRFFFCEQSQVMLPLVSLQNQEVEIRFYWSSSFPSGGQFDVYANFVYLSEEERKFFLNTPMNILITQCQRVTSMDNISLPLSLNHPVKYLLSRRAAWNDSAALVNLQINGQDVTDPKPGNPHYTAVPSFYHSTNQANKDVFLYPFCLSTSSYQPCGTLNFSRTENSKLVSTVAITTNVYAVNYNMLRIKNGQAGVMFAN